MNASRFCYKAVFCVVGLLLLLAGWQLAGQASQCRMAASKQAASVFSWEENPTSQGKLYIFRLPSGTSNFFRIGVSQTVATIESPQWKSLSGDVQPFFLINGGFFDPNNAKTTSFLYKNGSKVGDPHDNRQLVDNPKIQPYLEQIFNRTEFRTYECNKSLKNPEIRYDIVPHQTPIPQDCSLLDALGAGPQLLPQMDAQEEGFIDYNADGKLTRDPIGVFARNARSVIGLTANNTVIVMMGAQEPGTPGKNGFSLPDMAKELKVLGAVKAMALDGGSSSGVVYKGKAYYGKFNKDGIPVIRPVKSVLMLVPRPGNGY